MKLKDILTVIWVVVKRIIKWLATQVWAPISDRDWHLDPYKVGGFAFYAIAGFISLKIVGAAYVLSEGKLAIMAALVSAVAGLGTYLFNMGRKADDTLPQPK